MNRYDVESSVDLAWCPGCGNFSILQALKQALEELALEPARVVLVSGIGQAAKTPQYVQTNYFNGLHGRSLPVATAVKASNRELTVIAVSGDGCMYGEGGNHFIHTIRRNPDITVIVHDNMVYGLTKGQASPMSRRGFVTPVQVAGVILEPFNPLAVALVLGAGFVARTFAGDRDQTREVIARAIRYRGMALVDILQPCVSFNKVNTFQWYRDNSYALDGSHDPGDRQQALKVAMEEDRFALGVLYRQEGRPVFEEQLPAYADDDRALAERRPDRQRLSALVETLRL